MTGGIACGKSLAAKYLSELGVPTLDADDIVHELIPDPVERKRIAKVVFSDVVARQELEARLHPLVRGKIVAWMAEGEKAGDAIRVAIIPLLFEVGWEADYDEVWCLASLKGTQVKRMMGRRGYTQEEAEGRLAAQMDVEEKAKRSDRVIWNEGTVDELRAVIRKVVG